MATLLSGGTLIDGTGSAPRLADVLISGERIEGIAPIGQLEASDQVARVDCTGRTILPGLADLHVHLMLDGEADFLAGSADRRAPVEETIGYLMAKMARNAQRTLAAGFTLVRDAGAKHFLAVDLRRAVEDGVLLGPRILAAQPLIMTGGHGLAIGGIEADGPDAMRKMARLAIKHGADVIKVMATGGVATPGTEPGSPQLTVDEIRAAVDVARWSGRRTMTHAQGAIGIRNAVEAGVECIDHGQFMGTDDDLMRRVRERNVAYVPTLSNNRLKIAAEEEARSIGASFATAPSVMRKARLLVGHHRQTFEKAMQMGIPIGCGTDAGAPHNFHGRNAYELAVMVEYGMSPLDAITSATSRAAQIVGWDRELGTIEVGMLADLLVVNGDPLADITLLQDQRAIENVYLGGRLVAGHKVRPR